MAMTDLLVIGSISFLQLISNQSLPRVIKNFSPAEKLCPKGWKIIRKPAFGDINKDGINDLIVTLELMEDSKKDSFDKGERIALVALGSKKIGFSFNSLFINLAPSGVLGANQDEPECSVEHGSVVIRQSGGSPSGHYDQVSRYQYDGNKMILIGESFENYRYYDQGKTKKPIDAYAIIYTKDDYNLLIGLRKGIEKITNSDNMEPVQGTIPKIWSNRVLRAAKAKGRIDLDASNAQDSWDSFPLKLGVGDVYNSPKSSVSKYSTAVEVRGLSNGFDLWIQAKVVQNMISEGDHVTLTDQEQHEIAPIEVKKIILPHGYTWMAHYSLNPINKNARRVNYSINIVKVDPIGNTEFILSTRRISTGEIILDAPNHLPFGDE